MQQSDEGEVEIFGMFVRPSSTSLLPHFLGGPGGCPWQAITAGCSVGPCVDLFKIVRDCLCDGMPPCFVFWGWKVGRVTWQWRSDYVRLRITSHRMSNMANFQKSFTLDSERQFKIVAVDLYNDILCTKWPNPIRILLSRCCLQQFSSRLASKCRFLEAMISGKFGDFLTGVSCIRIFKPQNCVCYVFIHYSILP